MKKILPAIMLFFSLSAFLNSGSGRNSTFRQLYQLRGTWIMKGTKMNIGESWEKSSHNRLQGKGFMIRGNDTFITENIMLTKSKQGIYYSAAVEKQHNRSPVAFKLTHSNRRQFVFENPAHDFPKRITYSFISKDSLHAFIEDGDAGTNKRQDYYYKRVKL